MAFKLFGALLVATTLCTSSSQQATVDQNDIEALKAHVANLEARVQEKMKLKSSGDPRELGAHEAGIKNASTTLFLLASGALVMFMQAGFAILEAGSVTKKNTGIVLLKNLIDVCVGTLAWYFLGFGIAYGIADDPSKAVGSKNFAAGGFLETDSEDALSGSTLFRDWFFQWAFCATAATIVSGGVAERMALPSYVLYSIVMTGVIYPFVVYWTWSGEGWLTKGPKDDGVDGYSDFAGSGIVHLVGGVGALTGAILLGPRKGRFERPDDFKPCNGAMVVLGTFILWFGWYGFNCGSQLSMAGDGDAYAACLVAMNSTLAAATGGTTVFLIRLAVARGKEFDMCGMCNGILAGLVAICAGVANVEPSMAIVTGLVGGIFEELGHFLLLALKVDDPLDAFPVHGCGGIAGILTRPLFDWSGAKDTMFGWHCIGLGSIGAWVAVWSLFLMGIMKVIGKSKPGLFRVSSEEEETGGDTKLSHSPVKPYEKDTIWNDPAPAPASHEM
mmetsp:Transcript_144787/g.262970  ORF Transcript_144787/g.262970 Transcript_144787/m.262970 type:complete len:502 (-) Transcript_144787:78-1583(-)